MADFKRKKYLIKKSFQLRLMAKIFLTVLVVVFILSGSIYMLNRISLKGAYDLAYNNLEKVSGIRNNPEQGYSKTSLIIQSQQMAQNTLDALDEHKNIMWKTLLVAVCVSAVFVSIVFLFLSHRIAGPIFRFEKTLLALRDGDLSVRTHLRKHDEMKELAEAFNDVTDTLNERVNEISRNLQDLKRTFDQADVNGSAREQIGKSLDNLDQSVSQFKLNR